LLGEAYYAIISARLVTRPLVRPVRTGVCKVLDH